MEDLQRGSKLMWKEEESQGFGSANGPILILVNEEGVRVHVIKHQYST